MEQAMAEVMIIMQDTNQPDKAKALLPLLGKYPDIAMNLAKKGIKL